MNESVGTRSTDDVRQALAGQCANGRAVALDRRGAIGLLGGMALGAVLAGCGSLQSGSSGDVNDAGNAGNAAGAGNAASTGNAGSAGGASSDAPLVRQISLAEWSLNRALKAGEITNLDFPLQARRTYGISAVEYVSTFFAGKVADDSYLRELRTRCNGEGVRSVLIMIDREGDLGAADSGARRDAIEGHMRWLHAAQALGCFAIRVNARSEGTREEQMERSADGIGTLADRAQEMGLAVIVENHGGISSDGSWMAQLMKRIARPNIGTLPDFGNFRLSETEQYDRYKGMAEMMPWARDVSAKSYGFDATGNETTIDYARMFAILDAARYSGFVGIEFEGKTMSEPDGIRATKRLIERFGVRA
jgi:sugar phosphate isomerase/epimerase